MVGKRMPPANFAIKHNRKLCKFFARNTVSVGPNDFQFGTETPFMVS